MLLTTDIRYNCRRVYRLIGRSLYSAPAEMAIARHAYMIEQTNILADCYPGYGWQIVVHRGKICLDNPQYVADGTIHAETTVSALPSQTADKVHWEDDQDLTDTHIADSAYWKKERHMLPTVTAVDNVRWEDGPDPTCTAQKPLSIVWDTTDTPDYELQPYTFPGKTRTDDPASTLLNHHLDMSVPEGTTTSYRKPQQHRAQEQVLLEKLLNVTPDSD